jgi:hypothetical protein
MSRFAPDDISSAQLRLLEFVLQQATGQVERLRRQFEGDEITSGDAAEVVNKIAGALAIVTDPNGRPVATTR